MQMFSILLTPCKTVNIAYSALQQFTFFSREDNSIYKQTKSHNDSMALFKVVRQQLSQQEDFWTFEQLTRYSNTCFYEIV